MENTEKEKETKPKKDTRQSSRKHDSFIQQG